jgi:hypothetical protein
MLQKICVAGRTRHIATANEMQQWAADSGLSAEDMAPQAALELLKDACALALSDDLASPNFVAFLNLPWLVSLWRSVVVMKQLPQVSVHCEEVLS